MSSRRRQGRITWRWTGSRLRATMKSVMSGLSTFQVPWFKMDRKLCAALLKCCSGELLKSMMLDSQVAMLKHRHTLPALKVLRSVYRHLALSATMKSSSTLLDLYTLPWMGNHKIHEFKSRFVHLVNLTDGKVSDEELCEILLKEMMQCSLLDADRQHFLRLKTGDPEKNLEFLLDSLQRQIDYQRYEKNQKDHTLYFTGQTRGALFDSLVPKAQGQAHGSAGGQSRGNGKGQGSSGGSAPAGQSPAPRGKGTAQPKSSGGGKGKGNANAGDGGRAPQLSEAEREARREANRALLNKTDSKGVKVCLWFHTDEGCRRGAECTFSNIADCVTADEKKKLIAIAKQRARSRSQSAPRSTGACRQWMASKTCSYGSDCRYAHE